MNQNKYWKIFCVLACFALGAVSCWATAESLHFLLPNIPLVFMWVVAICFFVMASLGSKMIVDSLNKNVYTEHPGLKIMGGVFVMLVFWLICSMPTNTHTFFYSSVSSNIAIKELGDMRHYLMQLQNDQKNQERANTEIKSLQNRVDVILSKLHSEINNPGDPGFGPKVESILHELEIATGGQIQPMKPRDNSQAAKNEVEDSYIRQANNLLDAKKKQISGTSEALKNKKTQNVIKNRITQIEGHLNRLDRGEPIDEEFKGQIETTLSGAKSIIRENAKLVDFSDGDEENYTGEYASTSQFERLKSVFDVWKDFFAGKYAGLGFGFWILIAILIDLAGFIFFDLAFRRTN